MKHILWVILFCFTSSLYSQSILGKWKTIDDETGKEKSIVNIYMKDGKYFGDIVELINPKRPNPLCEVCKGENKDKPVLGMTIIKDMELSDDVFESGTILNPSNGKVYKCQLKLEENNNLLQVRGYVAFFYKTQYWKRVN
ncbi:DUF2147 domain-containing protein [uncultured Winogradskyella sp.]|uniref:DUF2147 domain-containing protein n=1 Tax=uncultured Winogradskyella sp. TaxID=395353 RepID=UPI0026250C9A|nr:DUF2147 domain-containing protein [uncultured Winogradskyella sp.]